jgi:hypothetical protein
MRGLYERSVTWDANIDGAFGRYFEGSGKWTGFVRGRAGVLFVREPLYDSIGFTYEYSPLSAATFGLQAEVLDLDLGLWAQAGGLLDIHARPGAMLALGWSLFGVEAQYRSFEGYGEGFAVYAKLRVPISILTRIFRTHHSSSKSTASSVP